MKSYNVKNKSVAGAIATENLKKPLIKNRIDSILKAAGYNPIQSIQRLQHNAEEGAGKKASAADSIRADELLLKLSGVLVERKQQVTMNLDTMQHGTLVNEQEYFSKLQTKRRK